MEKGVVKSCNESKGFGFIISNDSGEEIFVHVTGLKEDISVDDEVQYDVAQGKRGPISVNVQLA